MMINESSAAAREHVARKKWSRAESGFVSTGVS